MIICDVIATHARMRPNAPALIDLDRTQSWTYAELDRSVDRLAAWIVDHLGPNSGQRIATLTRNCAEMVILHHAATRGGAIFVPLNWRLAKAEILALLADADPMILFHDTDLDPMTDRQTLAVGELLSLGQNGRVPDPAARRPFGETACLLYTSGTSGRPKGVMLSEENFFWGATGYILANRVAHGSVFLCDMPLFHMAGIEGAARSIIQAGGTLLVAGAFDPGLTLRRMMDPLLKVSHYFCVPQMAAALWNHLDFDADRLRTIAGWTVGGAPNPKACSERFVTAGICLSEGFGMSETGPNFSMPAWDFDVLARKVGSCGLPMLGVQARIVDDEDQDVSPGIRGELWVRGPSVCQGYWNQPELSAKSFTDDWFRTGDTGMLDDEGFLYIVDRKKDMFISGGENIYPAEIEAVIAELDEVAEAAVVGVPDERWGEVGRAYVIPVAGRGVTAEEVIAHCAKRLARFKVPKTAVITTVITRTASGKVQKHLLRERALGEIVNVDPE